MLGTGEKLTAKQEQAIVALLEHAAVAKAAEACKDTETTLWRWLQLPAFQSRYRAARRQLVEAAIARLQSACTDAVDVLKEVAQDAAAPASARVTAARTILEQSMSAIQLTDLQAQVDDIKRLLAEHESDNRNSATPRPRRAS